MSFPLLTQVRRARRRVVILTAPAVAVALLAAGFASAPAAQAAVSQSPAKPLPTVAQKPVPVHPVRTGKIHLPAMRVPQPAAPAWPKAGSAEADISHDGRAGALPVWVGPARQQTTQSGAAPGQVKVTMKTRAAALAAGVSGVIFTVGQPGSTARRIHVTVSYAAFAQAYGGDYASRLRIVQLPGCALTTPQVTSCRKETPLSSANDAAARKLGANVSLPATPGAADTSSSPSAVVLAATATSVGSEGDYTATPLEQAGSWAQGGSSGAFTYSYPIGVPPVPGGLEPSISLDYDSQTADGLTSSTNNQASWIGDGWDYSPGYIERGYESCGQLSQQLTAAGDTNRIPVDAAGDLCWSGNNTTTLVLNGQATTLVPTSSAGTTWRAESDANETISYQTGSPNGTRSGGYWVLTEPDGTSYYFGVNELPGWATGDTSTESAENVQVYGVQSTDPCYNATWASSDCDTTWQWNLAYVTNPHGDAMSYFYNGESNAFAANGAADANEAYTRGAPLSKIYYGLRAGKYYGSTAGTVATAGGEVSFTTSTARTDIPTDLACTNGDACSVDSPTFWTKYELNDITTYELEGSGSGEGLKEADLWALGHGNNVSTDPDPDATAPLWLGSITRTGEDGTAIALPAVEFTGTYLANRVESSSGDSYPTVSRERLTGVVTETGGRILIAYDTPPGACSGTGTLPAEDANTGLCYPDWWNTGTASGTVESWFNKYVVTSVTQQNTAGGGTPVTTTYCYGGVGGAGSAACLARGAWHYDDSPLSLSKDRTWDQWRGFGEVTTKTGTAPDPVTEAEDTFFQGMDGDYQSNGTTSSVSMTPSHGNPIPDSNQFAGMKLDHVVCDGAQANGSDGFCGNQVTDTITIPWTSAATATQAQPSPLPSLQTFMTGDQETRTFTHGLAAGGDRESDVTYTHDSYGRVTSVSDVPDTADMSLDTCTATTYAGNTTAWILGLSAEVTKVSVPCGTTPTLPADAISDNLTFYDGATSLASDTPTTGNVTETEQATSYSGSTPQYTVESKATYDQYGRVLTSTDADGRTTTTAYTAPATGEEPSSVTVSDPTTQNGTSATTTELSTITTYDQARDLPLTVTTAAGYVTTETYDALGRLTAVWKPGDPTSGSATEKFSYTVSASAPSVTSTQTLDPSGGYLTDETLYDSMGRELQTQNETADGNRLVSDFQYDTDGWKLLVSNPYQVTGAPSPGQVSPDSDNEVPSQTGYVYDGDGRVIQQISYKLANKTWETDTAYGADYTTVTYQNKVTGEPDGGTPETTFTNGDGETTAIWQYHAGVTPSVSDPSGDYDSTSYAYSAAGQLATITDASGNAWTYHYNLAGNQTSASDPDTGTTNSSYDAAGQLTSVTDARNDQVSYVYDADGRKTAEYDTTTTGESSSDELASWTYDNLKKGLLTSSASYYNGAAYVEQATGYNTFGETEGTATTIPTAFGGSLTGTWEHTYSYNSYTGQEDAYQDTADGGLPAEDVTIGLNAGGDETALNSPAWDYVDTLSYTEYGQPSEYTLGTTSTPAWILDTYDEQQPQLLSTSLMQTGTTPVTVDNTTYSYDNTDQVTGEADIPANATAQVQCFSYDYLGRLSQAWSQSAASCTAGASQSAESGAAAGYWDQYTYDTSGDLTNVTSTPGSGTATVTQTTYDGPVGQQTATSVQPVHGIASATVTPSSGSPESAAYAYDQSGNLESVTGSAAPAGGQTLSWDDAGRLSQVKTASGTATYLYDAAGNLLIQQDAPAAGDGDATSTLYLGDEQIVADNVTGKLSGTRYYEIGGVTVAARTSTGTLDYLDGDVQGTASLAVNVSTLAVTRRFYDPYGNPVGSAAAWPGTRGFVGGTADPLSTLDDLGAREYQPATGTFTSADSVLTPYSPQDLDPYAYAADDPATQSDPTGLCPTGPMGEALNCNSTPVGTPAGSGGGDTGTAGSTGGGGGCGFLGLGCAWHATADFAGGAATGATSAFAGPIAEMEAEMVNSFPTGVTATGNLEYGNDVSASSMTTWHVGDPGSPLYKAAYYAAYYAAPLAAGAGADADVIAAEEGDELSAAACDGGRSFSPGTKVLLASGAAVPIASLKPGDKVLATNTKTGKTSAETVTAVLVHHDTDLYDLTVKTPRRTEVIHTTANHLFWDPYHHYWVSANKLSKGEHLKTPDGSLAVADGGTTPKVHDGWMWDLTVPGNNDHDFYVIAQAGDVPVLVHNCGVSDTRIISSSQSREQNLASINARPSGTGFNAIYDPTDGSFEARLSEGEDALVVRNGGHRIINRESFGGSDGTVAFTVIGRGEAGVELTWKSTSVNAYNWDQLEAPEEYRDAIRTAVNAATGLIVKG